MPNMHIALHRPFPKISIKVKPKECNATKLKTFPWSKLDAKLQEDGSLNASAATIGYPCNVERFWKYRDTWKKEFAFSDTIRQKNRQRMKKVLEQWRSRQGNVTREGGKEANPVVVGVHVRRDGLHQVSRDEDRWRSSSGPQVLQKRFRILQEEVGLPRVL
ncbi:uncharacterized protein LOC119570148 [Penaeus monodon]|uniref:uncharacterized protein LOC119570148 n=1 Tax=Penaeus monodon TaxID=6687 RepID=UPI0018A7158F|nr:uncharacterized protein LOC119570148 [Penaeus monodon]